MDKKFHIETEGIKYIGSKKKIIPHILELAHELDVTTVLDGFSGTTRVSQAFAKLGYKVISNDSALWSYIFGQCYLLNERSKEFIKKLSIISTVYRESMGGSQSIMAEIPKSLLQNARGNYIIQ